MSEKFLNALILTGALAASSFGWTQDLSLETPPEFIFESRHISGVGPVLQSCVPSEKGALRCKADRKLKAVECELASHLGQRSSKKGLRGKISGDQFLCERAPAEPFGAPYRISLLGAEGSFSEYSVSFAAPDQVKALYQQEMKYYSQRQDRFDRVKATLSVSQILGDGFTQLRGLSLEGEWMEGVWGTASFVQDTLGTSFVGQDWRLGLRWEFSPRTQRMIPFAALSLGELSREGDSFGVYDASLGLRMDLFGRWLSTESRVHVLYPQVSRLRNAYHLVQEFQWGPFFSRRLSFFASLSYMNEVWTPALNQPSWSLRALSYAGGLSVSFGDSR